jgi:hypothetical protein
MTSTNKSSAEAVQCYEKGFKELEICAFIKLSTVLNSLYLITCLFLLTRYIS